ncbi:MAG: hypothetical protein KC910_00690 [Candidatus Eremiobacteraeota bacterium]|nr:hypothetical protein [Candidatus Eremiobacteraeota bacterium]
MKVCSLTLPSGVRISNKEKGVAVDQPDDDRFFDRLELSQTDGRDLLVGKHQQLEFLPGGAVAIGNPGQAPDFHLKDGHLQNRIGDLLLDYPLTQHGTFRTPDGELAPALPVELLGRTTQPTEVDYVPAGIRHKRTLGKILHGATIGRYALAAGTFGVTWWKADLVCALAGATAALLAGSAVGLAGQAILKASAGESQFEMRFRGVGDSPVRWGRGVWDQWPDAPPEAGRSVSFESRQRSLECSLVNGVRLHCEGDGVTISHGRHQVTVPEASLKLVDGHPIIRENNVPMAIEKDGKLDVRVDAETRAAAESLKFPHAYTMIALTSSGAEGTLEGDDEEVVVNDFSVAIRQD